MTNKKIDFNDYSDSDIKLLCAVLNIGRVELMNRVRTSLEKVVPELGFAATFELRTPIIDDVMNRLIEDDIGE